MAENFTKEQMIEIADVVEAPRAPMQVDQTFELPKGLYVATVGLFLGFIALMAVGFANPEMIIPLVIFSFFIVAGFGVPAIWTHLAPDTGRKATTWGRFRQEGIMTATGRSTAGAATVQVLILPVLIFLWGIAAVTIAAMV